MPVFVGAGTSSFMKDTGGVGMSTATTSTRNSLSGLRAGQMIFNHTTNLMEYYNGTAWVAIDTPPTVTSVGNSNITEAEIASGYDLEVNGSFFSTGAVVQFIGNDGTSHTSPSVTVISASQLTARVHSSVSNSNEPYDVKVTNQSGLSNTLEDAFNVNAKPTWNTNAGLLATINDTTSGTHTTLSASDPEGDTVTYGETASVLSNAGLNLNSGNGTISGDPNNVSSSTTLSFTVNATSSGINTTPRSFSIIVNPVNDGSTAARAVQNPKVLYQTTGINQSGTYWIKAANFNSGNAVQAYILFDGNDGYLMCANYLHQGGTNPATQHRTTNFPQLGSSTLGTNESGTQYWGHVNGGTNGGLADFGTIDMVRWYGKTSFHSRVIHFQHNNSGTINMVNDANFGGSHTGLNNGSQTNLAGHNANLPNVANSLNNGWVGFPYYLSGNYHWGLYGGGNRWEVDDFAGASGGSSGYQYHTLHRIWVRYS